MTQAKVLSEKNVYMMMGEIIALRKHIAVMQMRVWELQNRRQPHIHDWGYDGGVGFDRECAEFKAELSEAEKGFSALGAKYGAFKAYFKHNYSEFYPQLKRQLWRVEQEIKGNTIPNLTKYSKLLDSMIAMIESSQTSIENSDNFKHAMSKEESKKQSLSYFEKEIKSKFLSAYITELTEFNKYLKKNNIKTITKDNIPRRAPDITTHLFAIKKQLQASLNLMQEAN